MAWHFDGPNCKRQLCVARSSDYTTHGLRRKVGGEFIASQGCYAVERTRFGENLPGRLHTVRVSCFEDSSVRSAADEVKAIAFKTAPYVPLLMKSKQNLISLSLCRMARQYFSWTTARRMWGTESTVGLVASRQVGQQRRLQTTLRQASNIGSVQPR